MIFRSVRTLRIVHKYFLTLCIQETPKRIVLQTVKTQMKCSIMLHFIRVYSVKVKKKNIFKQNNTIVFENYNLIPLDMYNGLSQFFLSNQKEESISIQRVNKVDLRALLVHSTNLFQLDFLVTFSY